MDELLKKYLKKCAARSLGEETIQNYRFNLLTFQSWWGNRELKNIDDEDIDDYTLYLMGLDTVGPTTVNNKLRNLRAFLKYGHTKGWCPDVTVHLVSKSQK